MEEYNTSKSFTVLGGLLLIGYLIGARRTNIKAAEYYNKGFIDAIDRMIPKSK